MDPNKKKRKTKVRPSEDGEKNLFSNGSFEMEDQDVPNNSKILNTFRETVKDAGTKNFALAAIVGARNIGSKWKKYVATKRIRLRKAKADEEGEENNTGGIGLDETSDLLDEGFKPFGNKDTKKKLRSGQDKLLIDYFAKLGRSTDLEALVDLEYVETLVRHNGANVNCTDRHGQTLLHEVCRTWHIDVAKFLFELGANVNQPDKYGRTPLHVAAAVDYPEMVKLLISNGANKEAVSNEEQTAVHYAAKNDACMSLKTLIDLGCLYKDVKDYRGRTPIFIAAELDRSETARQLLDLGASIRITDNYGNKVISSMITKMPPVAVDALKQLHSTDRPNRKQYFHLVDLLQDRKKDPNGKMQSALQCAVTYKQYDLLMNKVFSTLLDIMWKRFGRWRAWVNLLLNFTYILLWSTLGLVIEYDKRHQYNLPGDWWRIVLLLAAIGFTIWQIVEEVLEYKRSLVTHNNWTNARQKEIEKDLGYCHPRWPEEETYLKSESEILEDQKPKYISDFWNIFDWISYVFLLTSIITHLVDIFHHSEQLARAHIRIMSVTIILLWLRLMKIARAFSLLGPFIVMLGHMVKDMVRFAFLYLEFYLPFVCAFWMIFGGDKRKYSDRDVQNFNETELVSVNGYKDFGSVFFSLFRLTLVDDYDFDTMLEIDPIMSKILVGFWLALSAILCLNLFIALLSDTFQRVYDNAQANAQMQKAITVLSFWEGMSKSSRDKFLNYMEKNCSPLSIYYDDDMTEEGEEDLKKVTIQIKDELDDFRDQWNIQFGHSRGGGNNDDDDDDNSKGGNHRNVSVEKFENEVEILKEGMKEMQVRQQDMMDNFNQIKSLLLDLTGRNAVDDDDLYLGSRPSTARSGKSDLSQRAGRTKKKKKSKYYTSLQEEPVLETEDVPSDTPYTSKYSSPVVDVSMLDFPGSIPQVTRPSDVITTLRSTPSLEHGQDSAA